MSEPRNQKPSGPFRERDFYLAEFRGRTLVLVLPGDEPLAPEDRDVVAAVLEDLRANQTPVVLLSDDPSLLDALAKESIVAAQDDAWLGDAWRALQRDGRVAVSAAPGGEGLAAFCRRIVLTARVAKVVWLGAQGMLWLPDGRRRSLVPLASIEEHACAAEALTSGDPVDAGSGGAAKADGKATAELLREFERMIRGSASSVSACLPAGLADELFTYVGSGTFYAREGYSEVRDLGLDDFDAAEALIEYGIEEGFLLARSGVEIERVLTNGIGAFIEGRYLAGICALLPREEGRAGEIASLYAMTRFVGEGVGVHLVRAAIERARSRGMEYVFACTSSDRVAAFFERLEFDRVPGDALPESKWRGYDEDRREGTRCLRFDLR